MLIQEYDEVDESKIWNGGRPWIGQTVTMRVTKELLQKIKDEMRESEPQAEVIRRLLEDVLSCDVRDQNPVAQTGRPPIGPEVKARLQPELLKKIKKDQLEGESLAATIRRLLNEALDRRAQ